MATHANQIITTEQRFHLGKAALRFVGQTALFGLNAVMFPLTLGSWGAGTEMVQNLRSARAYLSLPSDMRQDYRQLQVAAHGAIISDQNRIPRLREAAYNKGLAVANYQPPRMTWDQHYDRLAKHFAPIAKREEYPGYRLLVLRQGEDSMQALHTRTYWDERRAGNENAGAAADAAVAAAKLERDVAAGRVENREEMIAGAARSAIGDAIKAEQESGDA